VDLGVCVHARVLGQMPAVTEVRHPLACQDMQSQLCVLMSDHCSLRNIICMFSRTHVFRMHVF
jgi:hypothetical protein